MSSISLVEGEGGGNNIASGHLSLCTRVHYPSILSQITCPYYLRSKPRTTLRCLQLVFLWENLSRVNIL